LYNFLNKYIYIYIYLENYTINNLNLSLIVTKHEVTLIYICKKLKRFNLYSFTAIYY